MKKKRLSNTLYLEERLKWFEKEKRFCYIENEAGALFSGVYRTKIYPSDLPEWYIRGQYYRQFGYLSTKGIVDLVYVPLKDPHHFLRGDVLLISYHEKIQFNQIGDFVLENYSGYDHRVYGREIINILRGARTFSHCDISPIILQIKQKLQMFRENQSETDKDGAWDFDIDDWFK